MGGHRLLVFACKQTMAAWSCSMFHFAAFRARSAHHGDVWPLPEHPCYGIPLDTTYMGLTYLLSWTLEITQPNVSIMYYKINI